MFDYILFDLDGTLTDSAPGITSCVEYALSKFGIKAADRAELKKFIGPPLAYSFKAFFGLSDEEAKQATEYYRERFSVTGLFENGLYGGIEKMLKELTESGKKLFVATGKPEIYTERILEHFGVSKYFTGVFGNTLDDKRPGKREIISAVLDFCPEIRTNLDPRGANAVMVGDRCYDIEGAKETSLPSIGVLYGFGSREELTGAGADFIAETVAALNEMLMK